MTTEKRPKMWYDGSMYTRRVPRTADEHERYRNQTGEDWGLPLAKPTSEPAGRPPRIFGSTLPDVYKPKYLHIFGFPMCCGAQIITGFYNQDYHIVEEVAAAKRNAVQAKAGLILAILNNDQMKHKGLLEHQGFVQVASSGNPVHSNNTVINLFVCAIGKDAQTSVGMKA